LTEEPRGAILSFDTSATPGFGSFGPVVLLQPVQQSFSVKNTGSVSVRVTLSVGGDGATSSSTGASSTPAPFTIAPSSFTVAAGGEQSDAIVFSPTGTTNHGALTISAGDSICAPLPSGLPLSGAGIGGG